MKTNQEKYLALLFVRQEGLNPARESMDRLAVYGHQLDMTEPYFPPERLLESLGSPTELERLSLSAKTDLVEEMLAYFRGEEDSCRLSKLVEDLSVSGVDYRLGFTLPSGNRKWAERRIDPGILSDARDRFVDQPHLKLEVLPSIGILVNPKLLGRPEGPG